MDADDVSLPYRLEKQLNFMSSHPAVGILGGACQVINAEGKILGTISKPEGDLQIRWASLLENPFIHSSVILRREVLRQHNLNYAAEYKVTQDYELWTRLLQYTHGANLDEPLILYRSHDQNVTMLHRQMQLQNHDRVALRTIQNQFPDYPLNLEMISSLRSMMLETGDLSSSSDQRIGLINAYLDLLEGFGKAHVHDFGWNAVKQQAVIKLIGIMKGGRFSGVRGRQFISILRIDPGIIWHILQHFLHKKISLNK